MEVTFLLSRMKKKKKYILAHFWQKQQQQQQQKLHFIHGIENILALKSHTVKKQTLFALSYIFGVNKKVVAI